MLDSIAGLAPIPTDVPAGGRSQPAPATADELADAAALIARGDRCLKWRNFDGASFAYAAALRRVPDHSGATTKLGLVAWAECDLQAAVRYLERAVRRAPLCHLAVNVLQTVYKELDEPDHAEAALRRYLALDPQDADAHRLLGQVLLKRELWAEGWREWEWRLRRPGFKAALDRPEVPPWEGEPLAGRTLLVLSFPNDGFGDHLTYVRYVRELRGGRVIVAAPEELHRLYRRCFAGIEFVAPGACPACDVWTLLSSLPVALPGDGAPPTAPYVWADPSDITVWRARLGLRPGALNVGIVWECSMRRGSRTIPLKDLAPLGRVRGIRWLSLQKGAAAWDPAPEGMALEPVGRELRGFDDTAAVAALLDVVISCDTSRANLCGALGLPAWVVLPTGSDWRWGQGEVSPWYRTLRLLRQQQPGDWSEPVSAMADELAKLAAAKGAGQ